MFQGQNRLDDTREPRCAFRMADIWFDLACQPLQPLSQVRGRYRANVNTMLTESVGDGFCLHKISSLRVKS